MKERSNAVVFVTEIAGNGIGTFPESFEVVVCANMFRLF